MKSMIIKQVVYFLLSMVILTISFNGYAGNKTNLADRTNRELKEHVISMHKLAIQLDKDNKTKKAINELEDILPYLEKIKDEKLQEKTYELLWHFYKKTSNKKKIAEYNALYNVMKANREKEELALINKESTTAIKSLQEEKKIIIRTVDSTTHELSITKDSLGILDLVNRERQGQIDLLNKEKELKDLKVKEQELIIKEEQAQKRFTYVILASLVLGLLTLSILAFYIYKNLQQKKLYSAKIEDQLVLIQHQHENITHSINYAQRIQNAMLPHQETFRELLPQSFVLFKPKDIVSGDFYWLHKTETGKVIIAAVDCTGHGVPGAFMSMIGFNLLNTIVAQGISEPHLILSALNKSVYHALQQHKSDNKDGMDMTICTIDENNRVIEFAGAKNPLIVIKNNELEVFKGDSHPIGGSQGGADKEYTKHVINIDQPTFVYMISDGYQDQFGGAEGKKFMIKNLKELFLQLHQEPFEQQRNVLDTTIEAWKGKKEKQIDDILIMGFKVG